MRPIPPQHRAIFDTDLYFKKCIRASDGNCDGRITIDHPWIYGGRQINEMWCYTPVCVYHHLGRGFNKHINQLHSLKRATPQDLAKYPKKNWQQELRTLEYALSTP